MDAISPDVPVSAADSVPGLPLGVGRPQLWPIVIFYGLLFVVLLGFLATTTYLRKETVSGELVPTGGILGVTARRDGTVSRVFVENGMDVREGQPLVSVSVDAQLENGRELGELLAEAAEVRTAALRQQMQAAEEGQRSALEDLRVRREALDRQVGLLERSHDVAAERVRMSEDRLVKMEPLLRKGYVSGLQFQQWQDMLSANKLSLVELEQRRSEAIRERDRLVVEQRQLRAKSLEDRVAVATAEADLLSSRASAMGQRELVLAAERSGLITALRARAGAPVKAGETLAAILPAGSRLQAQVWVPSRAIGFIRPGDEVKLMFDAFPYQTFGGKNGRVREVSRAPTSAQDQPFGTAQEPQYQVLIDLETERMDAYGRTWRLIPGMKVEAVVILERRTVLRWLLDPFFAFAKNASA